MAINIIRANRGLMGGYKAAGDEEDNTHVILVREDYEALVEHYKRLEKEQNDEITWLRREIDRLSQEVSDYSRMVSRREGELNITKAQMEETAAKAEAEVRAAHARNENLMRIMKERANAERGLRPKKQRSGYLLISVEDCHYRRGENSFSAQKVRLQSPYPAAVEAEVARTTIYYDLVEQGIAASMGLTELDDLDGSFRSRIETRSPELAEGNGAYDFRFKCNIQKGYWEVEFLAVKPVAIPADLLPEKPALSRR